MLVGFQFQKMIFKINKLTTHVKVALKLAQYKINVFWHFTLRNFSSFHLYPFLVEKSLFISYTWTIIIEIDTIFIVPSQLHNRSWYFEYVRVLQKTQLILQQNLKHSL